MMKEFLGNIDKEMKMEENAKFTDPDRMELQPGVKATLLNEILSLHHEYGYDSTVYGVEKIIDEWWTQKGRPMTKLFGNHPNYLKGKFMIVLNKDFSRTYSVKGIDEFLDYVLNVVIKNKANQYFSDDFCYSVLFKDEHGAFDSKYVTSDTKTEINKVNHIFFNIKINDNSLLSENVANTIREDMPELKPAKGQKVSRLIGKLCRKLGVDKDPDYNREYAKFCDAVNPTKIKRKAVISWNPIDYYTMSFGNSWTSCHTIDKRDKRNASGTSYQGCYSGGTQSYMLDTCSIVFYTLDNNNINSSPELEDKVTRCMFHLSPQRQYFIQGRMYPQDNDDCNSVYKEPREIMQKLISETWGIPNLWTNKKGVDECKRVIIHDGANYPDYFHYSSCNVSYPKGTENKLKLSTWIGHKGICPVCGEYHSEEETIVCDDCWEKGQYVYCHDCGSEINLEDAIEIDGEYYCRDCSTYCVYSAEPVKIEDCTYVMNYGYVSNEFLDEDSRSFFCCEWCEKWYHNSHMQIITEDGKTFCCSRCARKSGYIEVRNGDWIPEDDAFYCERCGELVSYNDYDFDNNVCKDCVEEIESDKAYITSFGTETVNLGMM